MPPGKPPGIPPPIPPGMPPPPPPAASPAFGIFCVVPSTTSSSASGRASRSLTSASTYSAFSKKPCVFTFRRLSSSRISDSFIFATSFASSRPDGVADWREFQAASCAADAEDGAGGGGAAAGGGGAAGAGGWSRAFSSAAASSSFSKILPRHSTPRSSSSAFSSFIRMLAASAAIRGTAQPRARAARRGLGAAREQRAAPANCNGAPRSRPHGDRHWEKDRRRRGRADRHGV